MTDIGFSICQCCEASIPVGAALCKRCDQAEQDYFDDYSMSPEEEAAAERAYENSRARAEWDHYHPGEPCPDIELPHPRGEGRPEAAGTKAPSPREASSEQNATPPPRRGR